MCIIGGSGYIGLALARYLLNTCDIKIIDVKSPPEDVINSAEYVNCDITNFEKLKNNLHNIDVIIHTAIIQIPLINEQKKLSYNVNIMGTQNICRIVNDTPEIKGMILTGTWHTMGEKDLSGIIDEEFGFRPDKVEDRARLYALSKMAQEAIVRFYDEMSDKVFGIIRMGTVLGEGMPEKTAANIFITQGIEGKSITPYKHSMYRPMLYVDINDVCKAYKNYIRVILNNKFPKNGNSLAHIVNVYYPEPITILELAEIIRVEIYTNTDGNINPKIEIVDKGEPLLFTKNEKNRIKLNITKAQELLKLDYLSSPVESIKRLVRLKISEY